MKQVEFNELELDKYYLLYHSEFNTNKNFSIVKIEGKDQTAAGYLCWDYTLYLRYSRFYQQFNVSTVSTHIVRGLTDDRDIEYFEMSEDDINSGLVIEGI